MIFVSIQHIGNNKKIEYETRAAAVAGQNTMAVITARRGRACISSTVHMPEIPGASSLAITLAIAHAAKQLAMAHSMVFKAPLPELQTPMDKITNLPAVIQGAA